MKKLMWIFISVIIIMFIYGISFLYSIFGNSKFDLKNINEAQKHEMVVLLNCAEISDDIELKEMQVPKVYRDFYYIIYFKTNNEKVKDYICNSDIYIRDLKKINSNNYCCTICRKDDKNIDALEKVMNNDYKEDTQTNNLVNKTEDVTQKISDSKVVHPGIINNIDEKYICYSDSDSNNLYFDKTMFSNVNGRTFDSMDLEDVKVGDYIYPFHKQILVYRKLSGEELDKELLYNLTLTNEERVFAVNSIELEDINIIDENTAIVKISYGDIIGESLTNERFTTLVKFNVNTKYYSKGHNINSVKDLEEAKGNINSILLEKDSINKKNPANVVSFECSDS